MKKLFLTEKEIEALGIRSAAALRNDRWKGRNVIPYVRVGKSIKYLVKDVRTFIERNRSE